LVFELRLLKQSGTKIIFEERKAKRKKFQQINCGTLVVGNLGRPQGARDADLIADHCPLETREGAHRRHLMSFFMHKDFLEARQRRTRS
jgi:hypothetical protein